MSSSPVQDYETPSTKSDIIALAVGNPLNRSNAKLSQVNQELLGLGDAGLLTRRYNHELQRCSQFYSLASIYNEISTKDKHRSYKRNVKKMYSSGKRHLLRLFICY